MTNNKPCLILDLDETVIHSVSESEKEDLSDDELERMENFKGHNMDDYFTVLERPGLQKFLDFAFENFNVAIWTAASKEYALFIAEEIIIAGKPERKLDFILFSYHCDISKREKKSIKKLDMIWDHYKIAGYTPENTIIMDDHPQVARSQKDKCIWMPPFELDDEDSEEDDVLYRIQKMLENKDDLSTINSMLKF